MFKQKDDEAATRALIVPRSILLVSAPQALAKRCRRVAVRTKELLTLECDLASLTNSAVERKPLAIVFPEHVYAFDSAEFDALARDVQASVVVLDPDITDEELDISLAAAVLRAEHLRQPGPPSSRYAVVPETPRRPKRR